MFQMIRKYVVFTNRVSFYHEIDSYCYVISVVTPDTNMNVFVGNAFIGYRALQFNLG